MAKDTLDQDGVARLVRHLVENRGMGEADAMRWIRKTFSILEDKVVA